MSGGKKHHVITLATSHTLHSGGEGCGLQDYVVINRRQRPDQHLRPVGVFNANYVDQVLQKLV